MAIGINLNVGCIIMKIKVAGILAIILTSLVFISGCQEEAVTTYLNVVLESDILELANASFVKQKDRDGDYYEAKLTWIFHNIAGRLVNAGIDFEFYDVNDNLIYSDTKQILNMPADHTEGFSPVHNVITLTGDEAQAADHVLIKAYEI
jgi:hypothetical protein